MTEHDITELKLMITELTSALKERCPRNTSDIQQLKKDMDGQHKIIRSVQSSIASTEKTITKHVGEMKVFITLMTAVLTAGAVKFIFG